MKLNSKQKAIVSSYFPELKGAMETASHGAAFDSIALALISKLDTIRGEPGYTPVKGKDYFTDKEVREFIQFIRDSAIPEEILKKATPKKGVHYRDGTDGRQGPPGKDGKTVVGPMGLMGTKGKDGSPDSPQQIANKLNSLPVGSLKADLIEGVITVYDHATKEKKILEGMARIDGRIKAIDQRWGGHGGGTGGKTYLVAGNNITITGTGTSGDPYVINSTASGSGSVTTVSVVSANGLAGTVANATTTPAITLSTTVTGLLKGNGTAISAATADVDYQNPITLTTSGTSGAATLIGDTLNIPQYTGGGGGTQAYEGPLVITGTTTATVNFVPIWITVNGLSLVSGYGWSRSGQTVTFDDVITGDILINFHNGTAVTGSTTYEVPTGTVNGVNTSFVFATAPSVVVVDGVAMQKTATDGTTNWTGTTTISLTIAPTFDVFGFDNSDSSFQQPTGTVNGANTSFTFATAPNVITVDGSTMKKVSSDGTVNWTGTTSISLTIAPTFDIFAFGGLTDFQTPSGTVNGVNATFVYSAAPNAIVVDGAIKRKTSADGTSNWSGTTTAVMVIAPTFTTFSP